MSPTFFLSSVMKLGKRAEKAEQAGTEKKFVVVGRFLR